jgi:hypothetical protein
VEFGVTGEDLWDDQPGRQWISMALLTSRFRVPSSQFVCSVPVPSSMFLVRRCPVRESTAAHLER